MPDSECGLLHYQAPQVDANGVEYCADSSSFFADLQELKYPVVLDLVPEDTPKSGEACFFSFQLELDNGDVLKPYDLAVTHTQPLHMMIIGPQSIDYAHVHPEPIGANGTWEFAFTPQMAGKYQVFAEVVLNRTKQILLMNSEFVVQGGQGVALADKDVKPQSHDVAYAWSSDVLSADTDNELVLTFSNDEGQPLELSPVMGALAHVVAFDEEQHGFAHLHPIYTGNERGEQPQLSFVFNTYKPGNYRLWAQYKIDEREFYKPIDVVVQ